MFSLYLLLILLFLPNPCFGGGVLVGDSTGTWYETNPANIGIGTYGICTTSGNCPSGGQDLSGYVQATRTVNGHALSGNVTVTNGDLGAVPTTTTITASSPLTGGGDLSANRSIGINTTGTWNGNAVTATTTSGNAGTATTLQTARAINGTNFDGSAAITVTAAAGTLTGNTLASGVTASSLTGLGTVSNLLTTGNVGLNSTAPGSLLDVQASFRGFGNGYFKGNVGIGTAGAIPTALYVVGTGTFTAGLNIGIGTASLSHLCVQNNAVSKCP